MTRLRPLGHAVAGERVRRLILVGLPAGLVSGKTVVCQADTVDVSRETNN